MRSCYKLLILSVAFFFVLGLAYVYSVSAQTINTGDATSQSVIENVVNTNIITCCKPTPTKKPEEPTPTEKPPTITPTPTTPPPGGPPGDGGRGGEPGPGGPAPAVLGLPQASGENSLVDLLKLLPAAGSFILGYSFLRKNG